MVIFDNVVQEVVSVRENFSTNNYELKQKRCNRCQAREKSGSQVTFGFVLTSDWLKRQLVGPDWLEQFGDVFEVFSAENRAIVFNVQFKVLFYLLCG